MLVSHNGYIFALGDLEPIGQLGKVLEDLDTFLGPFKGFPGNNVLEIYDFPGGWSAAWTHVFTDGFIYKDGAWINQSED